MERLTSVAAVRRQTAAAPSSPVSPHNIINQLPGSGAAWNSNQRPLTPAYGLPDDGPVNSASAKIVTYCPGLIPEIVNVKLPPGASVVPSGTPDGRNALGGSDVRFSEDNAN